jgi:hypothetical protein
LDAVVFDCIDWWRWSEESARYYEVLLSVEQGHGNWETLTAVFERASDENGVLAEPDKWGKGTDYAKGALVLAAIDREIRSATDGNRTLQDVLRCVNAANATLTVDRFVRIVGDVGGDAAATTARTYITTRALPDRFDAFASVYGYEDADLQRNITGLTASGPGWNRSLAREESLRVGVTETVRITARISNVGEAPGLARLGPIISSGEGSLERVDRPWVGWLAPGETVTRTATHRFAEPGTCELGVGPALSLTSGPGGQILGVEVVPDRETASVVRLGATSNATAGGRVDVTVRLRNDGIRATFVELPVRVGGDRVSTLPVVLDGGETRAVTAQFEAPAGQDSPVVAIGNATTTVGAPRGQRRRVPELHRRQRVRLVPPAVRRGRLVPPEPVAVRRGRPPLGSAWARSWRHYWCWSYWPGASMPQSVADGPRTTRRPQTGCHTRIRYGCVTHHRR